MKSLQEIKDELARHLTSVFAGSERDWHDMIHHDFEYGTGVSKVYSLDQLVDEVAVIFANQTAAAALKNAADNCVVYVVELDRAGDEHLVERCDNQAYVLEDGNVVTIDKGSILNTYNIPDLL